MSPKEIVLSRRKLLLGSAAIAVTPLLTSAQASSPPATSGLSASDRQVSVLPASDPTFMQAVEAIYPGLTGDSHFQMLSRLAMLVTSKQGPAIRAFTSCWSVTTANGTTTVPLFHFAKVGSKRHGRKGRTIVSAQRNVLRQGDSVLLTPFFSLSPGRYQKLGTDWYHLVHYGEPAAFLVSQLPNATATNTWIDSVIFHDRKALGAHDYDLINRLRVRRNAQHDLAGDVLKKMQSGSDSAAISAFLDSLNTGLHSTGNVHRWYRDARAEYAQFLGALQKSVDPSVFSNVINRASSIKRTKLKKLTA